MTKSAPGLTKRRLYKPERRPARTKGVLNDQAPVACPDATKKEIAMALFSLCEEANVVIGRGGEYDKLRDEYTIIGKSKLTGKAQDFKVKGFEVALLVMFLRSVQGGKRFDPMAMVKKFASGAVPA